MEITVENQTGAVYVVPKGDVDLSCSRDLQSRLKKVLEPKPGRVVVDLSGVPYMDSSGVATLVEAMQIARKQATKLILCAMQDKVRSIFEIARLDRVFTIVGSRDEAAKV
ncbi:MAG TPA: STAS domain-containing protein [Phycisphaerales bacterium]|nr:STAS domain-containing protein [Phycisphaerales bacterium]